MTIRIDVADAGWDNLVRQYDQVAPAIVRDESVALVQEALLYVERQVVLGLPENSGRLKQGLTTGIETAPAGGIVGFIGVEGPAAQYVWPVELGARPHWVPLEAMIQYVRDKNFAWTDKKTGKPLSIRSMAFLISRAISKRGTSARFGATTANPAGDGEIGGAHAGRNALVQGAPVVEQIVQRHTANLAKRLQELFKGGRP